MEDYQKIHTLQQQYMNEDSYKEGRIPIHETWFNEETADFWRHRRMYETIKPIAAFHNDKKWVSIGDGRYGLDAYRLKRMFNIDIFPTDLSQSMLEKGKERGIIKEYGVENAEQLSFPNQSYDLVFCKEAFHHFPRPIIALYEMIRVSRDAVVLIEPNERYTLAHPKVICKQLVKLIVNSLFPENTLMNKQYHFFYDIPYEIERSGNYIYKISRREMIKIAHGLNLKGLAWKGFNDCYFKGCEFEQADSKSKMFVRIQHQIKKRDRKCKFLPFFYDWSMTTVVLFKQEVHADLRANMEAFGYEFAKPFHNPRIA